MEFETVPLFLQAQGSYAEAKTLLERSLTIREKTLGSEDPRVTVALNNLALILEITGSCAEARSLYELGLGATLRHLSKNMGSMTETERFRYLDTQHGPDSLLLNLVALQENGPAEE